MLRDNFGASLLSPERVEMGVLEDYIVVHHGLCFECNQLARVTNCLYCTEGDAGSLCQACLTDHYTIHQLAKDSMCDDGPEFLEYDMEWGRRFQA